MIEVSISANPNRIGADLTIATLYIHESRDPSMTNARAMLAEDAIVVAATHKQGSAIATAE